MKPGQRIAGRYVFEEELGSGGMGSVYRARDTELDRPVAIKVAHEPDTTATPRLREEARKLAKVTSSHVVAIYDVAEDPTLGPFMAMELVLGRNLGEILKSEGPLSVSRAVHVVLQALRGAEALHREGLIHCDIKPTNILVSNKDGSVKLIDFGIAKDVLKTGEPGAQTTTRTQAFTPEYAAPEVRDGHKTGSSADVFSLGIVLKTCLVGDPASSLPSDIDENLRQIVHRATLPTPEARFQTARDFEHALLTWQHHAQKTASSERGQRLFRLAASVLVVVATLAVLRLGLASRSKLSSHIVAEIAGRAELVSPFRLPSELLSTNLELDDASSKQLLSPRTTSQPLPLDRRQANRSKRSSPAAPPTIPSVKAPEERASAPPVAPTNKAPELKPIRPPPRAH